MSVFVKCIPELCFVFFYKLNGAHACTHEAADSLTCEIHGGMEKKANTVFYSNEGRRSLVCLAPSVGV